MNISNRIYSRKILYRMVYMYNFVKNIMGNASYTEFANKIDNIVKHGLDKIDTEEFKKFDFTKLVLESKYSDDSEISIEKLLNALNPKYGEDFRAMVAYTANNFVISKYDETIEYNYIEQNMEYLIKNYENIVNHISGYFDTFVFSELNSIDQSILLLGYVENKVSGTHKNIIIKECLFLASTFTSDNSRKLINAILSKSID